MYLLREVIHHSHLRRSLSVLGIGVALAFGATGCLGCNVLQTGKSSLDSTPIANGSAPVLPTTPPQKKGGRGTPAPTATLPFGQPPTGPGATPTPKPTPTPPPSYPRTVNINKWLVCSSGCWATNQMTTYLRSVTILNYGGEVDVNVTYYNLTSQQIDIVFDPPDTLTDSTDTTANAYSSEGGTGYIAVPANGSIQYAIAFDGLDSSRGPNCAFSSDVEQGNVFTIYYQTAQLACQ